MAENELFQMRLSSGDAEALADLGAWYEGLTRQAIVRLALVELRRYVAGARRRKAEAAVLAEHMPNAMPRGKGDRVETVQRLPWSQELDDVERERRMNALPPLEGEALAQAVAARQAAGRIPAGHKAKR